MIQQCRTTKAKTIQQDRTKETNARQQNGIIVTNTIQQDKEVELCRNRTSFLFMTHLSLIKVLFSEINRINLITALSLSSPLVYFIVGDLFSYAKHYLLLLLLLMLLAENVTW